MSKRKYEQLDDGQSAETSSPHKRAKVSSQEDHYVSDLKKLSDCLKLNPNDEEALMSRGKIYAAQGCLDAAKADFELAIALIRGGILHSFPLEDLDDSSMFISSHLDKTDEPQEIKSMRALQFPNFRTNIIQTNRILTRLAQFAAEGKVKQVAKLAIIRPDLRLQVLFTLAGLGAQEEMEVILKEHPEALLVKAPLRDISGRVFDCSIFQHALWTLDIRYMANMMLDCLPNTTKGEAIRCELVHQYKEWERNGLCYQLKGEWFKPERHFSFQPLIEALNTYVNNYDNWTDDERKAHWCTGVGVAQTLIPAHIRHHYCDPHSFCQNPNINGPKLKRSLEIYNWILDKSQLWSEGLVGLGSDFGIFAVGGGWRDARGMRGPHMATATCNLPVLTALDKARTAIDLPTLIERLHTPIQNLEDDLGSVHLSKS
ncbi:MAG: hypothetical protein M1486_01830 [Gammaproteobacteria bacterium]|nr:hypothetical protein [Gammaproteobacteria bacterium]